MGLAELARRAAAASGLIVAVVGPECSGKTTLAMQLASRLDAPCLPEFARGYLAGRADYTEAYLEQIARGQLAAEIALVGANHPITVLDTDLIVIHVWWQEKYGQVPAWVAEHIRQQAPREYLLAKPDLPWQPDPQRESPTDRDRLFGVYQATLDAYGYPYTEIEGEGEARYQLAEAAVREQTGRSRS